MEKLILKKCLNCNQEKELKENFWKYPHRKKIFDYFCKVCRKNFLIKEYIELNKNITDISNETGDGRRLISIMLKDFGFQVRSISESKITKTNPILMNKEHQKLCVRDIAEIIGNITGGCALWWLKKHKIPIRLKTDALKPYQTSENNPMKGKFGELSSFFGKKHTEKAKEIISDKNRGQNTGSKNPAWKGGVTELKEKIRKSNEYLKWRNLVFNRDLYKCIECGYDKGGILEADHIKPFALILKENNIQNLEEAYLCQELWDVNNGRTLCKDCHKKTDTYGHKTTILIEEYKKNNEE